MSSWSSSAAVACPSRGRLRRRLGSSYFLPFRSFPCTSADSVFRSRLCGAGGVLDASTVGGGGSSRRRVGCACPSRAGLVVRANRSVDGWPFSELADTVAGRNQQLGENDQVRPIELTWAVRLPYRVGQVDCRWSFGSTDWRTVCFCHRQHIVYTFWRHTVGLGREGLRAGWALRRALCCLACVAYDVLS
jgi:hypothetical protein